MTIKKAFQSVIAFLESNKDARVSKVLDQVKEMCSAKQGGGTTARSFYKVGEAVVAARCGFFELWFDPTVVEFGKKAGTASGLNSMCKLGVNEWTSRNNAHKKGREEAFSQFTDNKITAEEFQTKLREIDAAKDAEKTLPEGVVGYATLDELLAAKGIAMTEEAAEEAAE